MSGTKTKRQLEALKKTNKKLWTPERRRQQSERIRAYNESMKGKQPPEMLAARMEGLKAWLDSPAGKKAYKRHGKRLKKLNASPEERKRRSELMKRRHAEGTTGLPKVAGTRRFVSPLPPKKPKDQSKNHMSPEARAKASEHMKRVNREVLTPERRAEAGRKQSRTLRNRPYTELEHPVSIGGPNGGEASLLSLIEPLGFRFVGDGKFWIGPCWSKKCRNPDFLYGSGKNKAALLFHGSYWHKRPGSDDAEELKDYRKAGWRVLVVWDKEMKKPEKVKSKVSRWLASLGFGKLATRRSTT